MSNPRRAPGGGCVLSVAESRGGVEARLSRSLSRARRASFEESASEISRGCKTELVRVHGPTPSCPSAALAEQRSPVLVPAACAPWRRSARSHGGVDVGEGGRSQAAINRACIPSPQANSSGSSELRARRNLRALQLEGDGLPGGGGRLGRGGCASDLRAPPARKLNLRSPSRPPLTPRGRSHRAARRGPSRSSSAPAARPPSTRRSR